jgi:hypothetical protein
MKKYTQTQSGRAIRIIWPENKWLTPERINSLYEDAIANQEDVEMGLTDPMEQARVLDDLGVITLGNQRNGGAT